MKKILLTGFEPFAGEKLNPAEIMLDEIHHRQVHGKILLPVSYEKSFSLLSAELSRGNYDRVVMLGLAGGRAKVGMERFLVNWADAEISDADQVLKSGVAISPNGPTAFQTELPLGGWLARARSLQLPLEISNSAGTYVCNYLAYRVAEKFWPSGFISLFVHLPFLPEQVVSKADNPPSLSKVAMRSCLEFILDQ